MTEQLLTETSSSTTGTTTVFSGGRIFTAAPGTDGATAWAEAIALRDGRILAVGTDAEVRGSVQGDGADIESIDLDGALVLPGFVDAHTHLLMFGGSLQQVDLVAAGSLDGILQRLQAGRDADPRAPRLLGRSWLFDAVPDRTPTRQQLDERFPDVPVYLTANDVHSVWLNTAALAELGITDDTPDPHGGRIQRDASGAATGMLYETAATAYAWTFLANAKTDTDRDDALTAAFAAYLEAGVTSVVDMMMDELGWAALQRFRAANGGALPIRVRAHWFVGRSGTEADDVAQVAEAARIARDEASDDLAVIGIKIVADGVIDACTAAMRAPYANGTNGDPIWSLDALTPVVVAADAAGLQVAIHAIGDAASDIALDAIERAIATGGDIPRRHRIEHLETVAAENVDRLARLGVTASMQPVHADPAIQENWRAMLGDDRADRGFPWQEFVDAGALLAFGTDAPTAPHAALANLFIAVTRRSALDPSLPAIRPEDAVRLAGAIGHASRDAATSCGLGERAGRLAEGFDADLVVLDTDPFTEGEESLLGARVVRTVRGGTTVHHLHV
ncbi:MAG TPA: amidohydrolase [Plantibacter sp.]|uniref:amidohydrolase n=1 Tax=unclassified Plantibacter TaxID=2624265 RepID=UPI002CED202E|nr:amidohydrolase [Plantibacter sp.]